MADSIRTLRTAVAGYARFNNDDVKAAFFRLIDQVETDLDDAGYDESSTTDESTQALVEAMDEADEEEEIEEELAEEGEEGS
jgi:hypothetical protein